MTRNEVNDYLSLNTVSAKRRRKQTKAERKKALRRGAKLRRIRKYRSKVKRAKGPGMKATIMLPDGKRKKIRKKFYITTWDSKGNPTGTLWYTSAQPDKEELEAYRQKYGVKHPMQLAIKKDMAAKRKR
jgi:hypothetical protein